MIVTVQPWLLVAEVHGHVYCDGNASPTTRLEHLVESIARFWLPETSIPPLYRFCVPPNFYYGISGSNGGRLGTAYCDNIGLNIC